MKDFQINPFNVVGGRKLDFLPPHISPVQYKREIRMDAIDWIEHNLKGRYFFGTLTKLENDRIVQYNALGFEDPHELTLFLLGYNQN